MLVPLVYSCALILACLLSDLAGRSLLSISVLFLLVGFAAGSLGFIPRDPSDPLMWWLAELSLVVVLFTDAAKVGIKDLLAAWRLPGRALLLGMPLTFGGTALAAHFAAGLGWIPALLVGAVLSPTDPIFASALVSSREVPGKLRFLLNVESGVNDGLALPPVLLLLGALGGLQPEDARVLPILLQLVEGLAVGALITWLAMFLEQRFWFKAHASYLSIFGFAVIATVFCAAKLLGANEFLAAFASGVTVASTREDLRRKLFGFCEDLGEIVKLATLMLFGAYLSLRFFTRISWGDALFIAVAVLLVRPLAIQLALVGSELGGRERLVASIFGPKGFASVVFGLMILRSGVEDGPRLFRLIALTVALSVTLLSSADIFAQRWLKLGRAKNSSAARK